VALLVLVLAATITTGFVWRNRLEDQRKIEKADNLADSAAVMDQDPELELLLAIEAAKIMFTPKAQAEFIKALSAPLHTTLTEHERPVRSAVFSPNGKYIATASEDMRVILWDFENLYDFTPIKHPEVVMNVTFSPDSKFLATACKDGTTRIYQVDEKTAGSDWKPVAGLRANERSVRSIAFSPDGNLIATGSEDNAVRIWRQTGNSKWELISEIKGPSSTRTGGQVCTPAQTETLPGHTSSVQSVAFSSDGQFLVTASRDQTAKVWKVGTWELLQTLHDRSVVRGAVFSPDGQLIVTGNEGCQTKFWKRQEDRWGKLEGDKYVPDQTLPLQSGCSRETEEVTQVGYIDAVNFSPDGKFLVTASRDGTVFIRRSGSWEKVKSLIGHQGEVYFAAYSPDGKFVVSAGDDKRVIIWEPLVAKPPANSSLQDLLKIAEPRLRRSLDCYELNRFQLCDRSRFPKCCR
jgi:WD40 repeat protein